MAGKWQCAVHEPGGNIQRLVEYDSTFLPGNTCHVVYKSVELGKRYRVELHVDANDPWFDGSHPTDPKGLRARDLGLAGILGGPFRRVIEANFLQPSSRSGSRPARGAWTMRTSPRWYWRKTEPRLFVGEFKAGRAASCSSSPTTRRLAAESDVFLRVAPRQEPRKRDAQDRPARGGPDSVGAPHRSPGTRRQADRPPSSALSEEGRWASAR